MPKHQPAIIEVTHTEGDNEISFAIRGSSQWLNDNLTLVTLTLTTMVKPMMDRADETQRAELLAGINALREMESFQGDFVRVSIAKEANNEPDEISA